MELFRTIASALFLVGFFAFPRRVEAFPELSQNEKVHEQLIPVEVAGFSESTHESESESKAMKFHGQRVRKRDSRSTSEQIPLDDDGLLRDVGIWLEPAENVLAGISTPVSLAKVDRANGEVIYEEVEDPWEDVIRRVLLNLRIRPDSWKDSKTAWRALHEKQHHNSAEVSQTIANDEGKATTESPASLNTSTFTIPNVVYPEIMLIVDYAVFTDFNHSINETLAYVLALWDQVDLIYRTLEEPKITFNIARIVIGVEEGSTPYLTDNMYNNSDWMNGRKALHAAERYFSSHFNHYNHDMVIIITGIQLASNGGVRKDHGIAKLGGACSPATKLALIEQNRRSFALTFAAHELAHLLGADHVEGTACAGELDIMLSDSGSPHEEFTRCSAAAISRFLKSDAARCLYNKPDVKDPLPRVWPNLNSDRDQICRTMGLGPNCYTGKAGQHACFPACTVETDNGTAECWQFGIPARLHGTDCGDGKKCFRGECLESPPLRQFRLIDIRK